MGGTPGDFSTIIRKEFDEAKANGDFAVSAGKVPVLLVDGQPLCGQSKAIERFVAQQVGLMGSDAFQAAKIDALCENIRDIKDAYNAAKRTPEAEKEAAIAKFFAETLPKWCKDTEAALPAPAGPWLVGDKISYADVAWFVFVGADAAAKPFFDNVEGAKKAYADCPRIVAAMQAVANNEDIKTYLAKRPETMI